MKPTMIKTTVMVVFGAVIALSASVQPSHAAAPGKGAACDSAYPIVMVSSDGVGRNVPTNQTMTITLTGPITNANKLKRGGKQTVKICEGAVLDYRAESTVGTATCTLDKRPIPSQGKIKADDGSQRLVCTNKPDGEDTDQFRIVGVTH